MDGYTKYISPIQDSQMKFEALIEIIRDQLRSQAQNDRGIKDLEKVMVTSGVVPSRRIEKS